MFVRCNKTLFCPSFIQVINQELCSLTNYKRVLCCALLGLHHGQSIFSLSLRFSTTASLVILLHRFHKLVPGCGQSEAASCMAILAISPCMTVLADSQQGRCAGKAKFPRNIPFSTRKTYFDSRAYHLTLSFFETGGVLELFLRGFRKHSRAP